MSEFSDEQITTAQPSWAPPGGPFTPPPGPPPKKHRVLRVVLLCLAGFVGFIVVIAVAAAVAGSGPKVARSAAPPQSPTASTSASSVPAATSQDNLTGPVGTAFTVSTTDQGGNNVSYDVAATQILDPARGADEFTTPGTGKRFVGVEFKITGDTGYSSDDANNDAVIQGSDGQSYTADFSSISAGTNFNYGSFSVAAGHTQTGWVTFQLPWGVRVTSVQWQANVFGDSQPATWTR